jgi:hypothetical protein
MEKEFDKWLIKNIGIQDASIFSKGSQVRQVAIDFAKYKSNYNENSNFIKGQCHTNLDDYDCLSSPTVFARVPNVGERVACRYKGNVSSLKICQITHDVKDNKPFIIVELTKDVFKL